MDPGRCTLGCSGAMEVASELMFVPEPAVLVVVAGESSLTGWLTDLCKGVATFRGVSLVGVCSRGFLFGERLVPTSDEVRRWPFDLEDCCRSRIFILESLLLGSFSSSGIVSTKIGFPGLGFHFPAVEVWSVSGGLGGALSLVVDKRSLEAFRSVVGGVKMLRGVRGATASRLCSLEKVGYGRLDLESFLGVSSSTMSPGMEDLLLDSEGDKEDREEVFSLVEVLRWEEDLWCRSFSFSRSRSRSLSLSFLSVDLEVSFFSLRRSGLLSLILDGIV